MTQEAEQEYTHDSNIGKNPIRQFSVRSSGDELHASMDRDAQSPQNMNSIYGTIDGQKERGEGIKSRGLHSRAKSLTVTTADQPNQGNATSKRTVDQHSDLLTLEMEQVKLLAKLSTSQLNERNASLHLREADRVKALISNFKDHLF